LNVNKTISKGKSSNTNRLTVLEDKLDKLLSILDNKMSSPTKEVTSSSSKRVSTNESFIKSLENAIVKPNIIVRLSHSMKSYSIISTYNTPEEVEQKDCMISVIKQNSLGGVAGYTRKMWISLDKLTQFKGVMGEAGLGIEMREH
jgi:hypothetical protein